MIERNWFFSCEIYLEGGNRIKIFRIFCCRSWFANHIEQFDYINKLVSSEFNVEVAEIVPISFNRL